MLSVSQHQEAILSLSMSLNLSDREWLIAKLEDERGVLRAQFTYPDLHHLRVVYDPSSVSDKVLLDSVERLGLSAQFPQSEAPQIERVLVAVAPGGESTTTLDYVSQIATGHENLHLCLYCRLPALPPALREHGGSENAARERELGLELSAKVDQWISEKRDELRPVLEMASARLQSAGIPETAIEIESSGDASRGESLAEALVRVARASGCHTIAVSRQHGSIASELLRRHTSDTLAHIASGLALWIVE